MTAHVVTPRERGINQDQQDETRNDGEYVGNKHQDIIHDAAQVPGQQTDQQAQQCRNRSGDQSDQQGNPGGLHQLGQGVPAEVVCSERQRNAVRHFIYLYIVASRDSRSRDFLALTLARYR